MMNIKHISLQINDKEYWVPEGLTILEAAKHAGIIIPTLCYLEKISNYGSCGVCVVEVKGARTLQRACLTKAVEGMQILTASRRVMEARRTNVELLLASHPKECPTCDKNETCELRRISAQLGIKKGRFAKTRDFEYPLDETSPSLVRDPNKCILCHRCVGVCAEVQSVFAIDYAHRGAMNRVSTFLDRGLGNVECVNCGQCLLVCPTGAISEKDQVPDVWKAIQDPDKVVLVQTAPSVRVAVGEEFGLPSEKAQTGKMIAALRRLGFDKVFDTQFTADLTIMEEAHELIGRIKKKGALPMITSCSPGWVKFAEHFFPKALKHVSSCKSPQQMFGTVAKTFYAEKTGIDPRRIVVVSIMPCTAKKYEAARPEMNGAFKYWQPKLNLKDSESFPDVDFVLTTRELASMIKEAGVDFAALHDEDYDDPLGESSGAGVIFGATGGVMEAALRTAYEVITGKTLAKLDFTEVRGLAGIKEAEVKIGDLALKVAVASGLGNARKLLEQVQAGKSPYHFIEIMTCPGGCLAGGGQPISRDPEIKQKRAKAIYAEDAGKAVRKSHENPSIKKIYEEFFSQPLSDKSHHLLHTKYRTRPIHKA